MLENFLFFHYRAAMKAASSSALAQLGTTQQITTIRSAATSGQQPSPHSNTPGHVSSRATAGSPSADAINSHPDHYTSGSNTVDLAAALGRQQGNVQGYQAQTQPHRGTSFILPSMQGNQARAADGMPDCTDAMGTMYNAEGRMHEDGGAVGGAMHGDGAPPGGAMRGARGAMHDDLWTQEGSIVEYPAAYRQQVRLHCDWTLC